MTRSRDEEELREYLGAAYDHARLVRWQEQLEEEAAGVDEATLYRTSEAYLYNLTAFAMTGTKAPYLDVVRALVPPGGSILDFGCGIGSDGLVLLEEGYRVAFADFDNPSVAYLRWRLERRGLAADVLDLDAGALPGGFDLAFAFDVLEHASSWDDVLARMEACAALVCVNALETSPQETSSLLGTLICLPTPRSVGSLVFSSVIVFSFRCALSRRAACGASARSSLRTCWQPRSSPEARR